MTGSAADWASTNTSPEATVPARLIVSPAVELPLKYIWTLYEFAPRSTGAPVPLKISRALLLLDPSMYSEKKSSVGCAFALPSAKTSGTIATTARRNGKSRLRGADGLGDIDEPPGLSRIARW